jgi:hypothetical protein
MMMMLLCFTGREERKATKGSVWRLGRDHRDEWDLLDEMLEAEERKICKTDEDEEMREEERREKKQKRGEDRILRCDASSSPTRLTRQQLPISINLISTKAACDRS